MFGFGVLFWRDVFCGWWNGEEVYYSSYVAQFMTVSCAWELCVFQHEQKEYWSPLQRSPPRRSSTLKYYLTKRCVFQSCCLMQGVFSVYCTYMNTIYMYTVYKVYIYYISHTCACDTSESESNCRIACCCCCK